MPRFDPKTYTYRHLTIPELLFFEFSETLSLTRYWGRHDPRTKHIKHLRELSSRRPHSHKCCATKSQTVCAKPATAIIIPHDVSGPLLKDAVFCCDAEKCEKSLRMALKSTDVYDLSFDGLEDFCKERHRLPDEVGYFAFYLAKGWGLVTESRELDYAALDRFFNEDSGPDPSANNSTN